MSFAAFVFAALHLENVTANTTTCMPANIFTVNASCICLFGASNSTNHLEIKTQEEGEITVGGFEFQYRYTFFFKLLINRRLYLNFFFYYRDLNCSEVTGAWKYILIASTVLNCLGFLLSFGYLTLLCFRQKNERSKTTYAPVRSRL